MLLDATKAEALKDAGMQLALQFAGDEWARRVVAEFREWAAKQKAAGVSVVTIETFRAQAKSQPERHQAWGSVPTMLCRDGLIAPQWAAPGQQMRVKAASVRTHHHEVKCWRLL